MTYLWEHQFLLEIGGSEHCNHFVVDMPYLNIVFVTFCGGFSLFWYSSTAIRPVALTGFMLLLKLLKNSLNLS